MNKHKCRIDNYYFGSFMPEKEFAVPTAIADYMAFDMQVRAYFEQCRQSGESTAKAAVAGDCPDECKYKHSCIAVMLDQFACNAEDKFVGKKKIQIWRVQVVVNWIALVVCNDHAPDSGPDTTVSYSQLLEWMPEDRRIQAIADQKRLYKQ